MMADVPYKLSGTKVVKSDTGEVVKDHPTREKALAHLRALKANVEESSPAVLGALLGEGFDAARHPRDFHGRWRKGDKVHVITSQGRTELGVVEKPAETYDTITSKGSERATTVTVKWADGDVTHERPGDIKAGHPARSLPTSRRATLGRAEGDAAARTRAEILAKSPGAAADLARHQSIAQGASQPPDRHGGFKIGDVVTHETGSRGAGGHGPVTFTKQPGLSTVVGLQRNGNLRLKHPGTGTTHDVHYLHAQKVSPLHPDYRGKVVQDAYAAQRAALAAEKAARARRLGEAAPGVLDSLLEGFAAAPADPFPDHPFTTGDQVHVSVGNGARAVTGRVMRPHGGPPPTHAVVAPEGGGAHVLAPVGQVKLNTPAQHAAAQKRRERDETRQAQQQARDKWMSQKPPGLKESSGVSVLLEAFAVAAPGETPAQSQARGAQDVKTAQAQLASGWNAQKHPRGRGGKFGYTTGGKRAKRGPASSSRTLGQGSSGALVKSIQGRVGVAADGIYGPQTRAAVARFQSQHRGLQVDGVVGAQTLAALRGHPNPASVKPGPIKSSQATVRPHAKAAKPKAPLRMAGGVVV